MLTKIRLALALAEDLHFRRTSDRTGVSQARLSEAIRQLEHHLGVALFERTTRSVRLTAAGLAFLPHARLALDATERAVRDADEGEPPIRIGAHDYAMDHVVPLILAALRRHQPGRLIRLIEKQAGTELVAAVRTGAADLAVLPSQPSPTSARATVVVSVALGLVTTPTTARSLPSALRPDDLDNLGLVDLDDPPLLAPDGVLRDWLTRHAVTPRIEAVARDVDALVALVASGAGAGLVPVPWRRRTGVGLTVLQFVDQPPALPLVLLAAESPEGRMAGRVAGAAIMPAAGQEGSAPAA